MIDSRVVVKAFAVVTMLALVLPIADASAKDIRWLREEQGNVNREQPREGWTMAAGEPAGALVRNAVGTAHVADERRQLRRDVPRCRPRNLSFTQIIGGADSPKIRKLIDGG